MNRWKVGAVSGIGTGNEEEMSFGMDGVSCDCLVGVGGLVVLLVENGEGGVGGGGVCLLYLGRGGRFV